MKKSKIDLKNLQVKSFVTATNSKVKGGLKKVDIIDPGNPTPATYCFVCDTF